MVSIEACRKFFWMKRMSLPASAWWVAAGCRTQKSEHRQLLEELQATLAAQERSFQQEIDKATKRSEGVQRHVILQFAEAREAQLSKANRKNEQLLDEVQQIRRQITSETQNV